MGNSQQTNRIANTTTPLISGKGTSGLRDYSSTFFTEHKKKIYILVGIVVVALIVSLIIYLVQKNEPKDNAPPATPIPKQTVTFMIDLAGFKPFIRSGTIFGRAYNNNDINYENAEKRALIFTDGNSSIPRIVDFLSNSYTNHVLDAIQVNGILFKNVDRNGTPLTYNPNETRDPSVRYGSEYNKYIGGRGGLVMGTEYDSSTNSFNILYNNEVIGSVRYDGRRDWNLEIDPSKPGENTDTLIALGIAVVFMKKARETRN